jgi:hypothetical protein
MIISRIIGGLGNQMFQFAAGRALSLATQQNHSLDLTDFIDYDLHQGFEISRVFRAPVREVTYSEVKNLLGWRSGKLTRKILKYLNYPLLNGSHLAIEPYFHYWPQLTQSDEPRYLMGYWQSEKYFKKFEQVIRSDFIFKDSLKGKNLEIAEQMQGCQSVSLHIRRGDYITDTATAKVLNVCPPSYYSSAIKKITQTSASPHFFIFSDDLQWARENLDIPFPSYFVEGNNGSHSYMDMQLMSFCKHQIIANSSFSWWGAWLNSNPNKVVIAPQNWFCNNTNDNDLIPFEWIRI